MKMCLQASAILALLERYSWHSFTIITGMIAGHRNFDQVRCLEDQRLGWLHATAWHIGALRLKLFLYITVQLLLKVDNDLLAGMMLLEG